MKKNVNFRIPEETHRRLNVLAAYAQENEGETVTRLIEAAWQQRHATIPDPAAVRRADAASR